MKTVGITGGIGSGKSTVCEIFKLLGVPIYNADNQAKFLMNNDPEVKAQIIEAFGSESYLKGELNRNYLAKTVFSNGKQLAILNSIVHPAVSKDFSRWVEKQSHPYVIKEAALLIESGSYKTLDHLVNVIASLDTRIKRVMKRDSFRSEEEIRGIIDKQATEEERNSAANYTINNDGNQLVIPQVLYLNQMFTG